MISLRSKPRSTAVLSFTSALLVTCAWAAPAHAQTTAPSYRVEIIPKLPGNVVATYLKVNESGQVLASGVRTDNGSQQTTSVVWSGPGPGQSSTPSLAGFGPSFITDNGTLVGGYNFGVAALAPNGSYTMLTSGQAGDRTTVAVVAPNGDFAGTNDFSGQAIYRNRSGAVSVTALPNGKKPGRWTGMNNDGVVAGTATDGGGLNFNQAWVLRNGVANYLPQTADGFVGGTVAVDLDSRGRVLGRITNGTGNRAAIWGANDVATLLIAPAGFTVRGAAFNASSTVLSYYDNISGIPVPGAYGQGINTPDGNYSWASIVDPVSATWRVLEWLDISDSGYIVGRAVLPTNDIVAFRMTLISAVPEPGTAVSLALGGAFVLLAWRRAQGRRDEALGAAA